MYGLINTGLTINELMDYGKRKINVNEPELTFSEGATAQVQYSLSGLPVIVEVLSNDQLKAVLTEAQKYETLWNALPVDETLGITLVM